MCSTLTYNIVAVYSKLMYNIVPIYSTAIYDILTVHSTLIYNFSMFKVIQQQFIKSSQVSQTYFIKPFLLTTQFN